jgi:hypothetical protein
VTARGRVRLQRSLCFVGAFVALALGVTSFDLLILVVGFAVAIGLLILAVRLSPEPSATGPLDEGE